MESWAAWARGFEGPEHRSLWLAGDRPVAVLLHGVPGTPAELRPLAEGLHNAGWTVRAPLLPGFGADLATLPDRRRDEWVAAARAEWRLLAAHHQPTLLLGYSAGAAIALEVAARERVPALALVAPWLAPEGALSRWAWPVVRRLFREVRPFKRMAIDWESPAVHEAIARLWPDGDPDDPAVRRALRDQPMPTRLLDELLRLGREARVSAGRHTGATLVVQPRRDVLTERAQALGLVGALAGPVQYLELEGGHDLVTPNRPGHDALMTAIARFAWDAWSPLTGPRTPQLDRH